MCGSDSISFVDVTTVYRAAIFVIAVREMDYQRIRLYGTCCILWQDAPHFSSKVYLLRHFVFYHTVGVVKLLKEKFNGKKKKMKEWG